MDTMAERMLITNIALDVCSIVLTLIAIAYLLSDRRYRKRRFYPFADQRTLWRRQKNSLWMWRFWIYR